MPNYNYIFDSGLQLKDAGAVTTSGQGQVGGSARIVDLGDGDVRGDLVLDVSAIDTTSADESYKLILQGSNSASFASGNEGLAFIALGSATGVQGFNVVGAATAAGRYIVSFRNERGGTRYRYVRMQHVPAGTTPSINYVAYLSLGRPAGM